MNRFLNRIEVIFLGLLVLSALVIWAVQALWITPEHHCEAEGNWWDAKTRTCGHVVYLPDITHRPIGSKPLTAKALRSLYPDLPKTRAQALGEGSAPLPAPAAHH